MISYNEIDGLDASAEDKAELKILVAATDKFLQDIKRKPELRTQFLQEVGFLDAEGNRNVFAGEENLGVSKSRTKNGETT